MHYSSVNMIIFLCRNMLSPLDNMIYIHSVVLEASALKSAAGWSSSVVTTGNLQLAAASGLLVFWYHETLTESCWNAHSGVKWAEVWLFCTLCLDSWLSSPPHSSSLYISPIHCFLFPVVLPVSPSSSTVYRERLFLVFLLLFSFNWIPPSLLLNSFPNPCLSFFFFWVTFVLSDCEI